ncbi:MAG: hypothetical protein I8H71_10950 [Xanthomonadaceae bacterium]|nr:hypothetical protein [Xanthomonadaceae bacterium]
MHDQSNTKNETDWSVVGNIKNLTTSAPTHPQSPSQTALGEKGPLLEWGEASGIGDGAFPSVALNKDISLTVHEGGAFNAQLFYNTGPIRGGFGDAIPYDSGGYPFIAMNDNGQLVEVHQSGFDLYYRVGKIHQNGTVTWGPSLWFDNGHWSSVAINNLGAVIEVHNNGANQLYYNIGTISGDKILWNKKAVNYDNGYTPSITLNNNGLVLECHVESLHRRLRNKIGLVKTNENGELKIEWDYNIWYDDGAAPSISINDAGNVVEVHQSGASYDLYYRVGQYSDYSGSVAWSDQNGIRYDGGRLPRVAINQNGQIKEVHQSEAAPTIWFRDGLIYWPTQDLDRSAVASADVMAALNSIPVIGSVAATSIDPSMIGQQASNAQPNPGGSD